MYYFQPPFSGLASRFFDVGFLHSHSPLFKLCNILILNCFLPIKCILQFANCTCTPSHLLCSRQCILCWTPLTECYDSTIIFHRFFCFRKNIYMRMCESVCVCMCFMKTCGKIQVRNLLPTITIVVFSCSKSHFGTAIGIFNRKQFAIERISYIYKHWIWNSLLGTRNEHTI